MQKIRFVDLFSGVGGFRYTLERFADQNRIGVESIAFSEIDRHALTTYFANFKINQKEIRIGDINQSYRTLKNIDDIDFLFAGFPCQPFSILGSKKGFSDHRGGLFFKILELVREITPQCLILENVRGLKFHDQGRTLKKMKHFLNQLGYVIHEWLLDSKDYGVPQTRRRLYLICFNKELEANKSLASPTPIPKSNYKYQSTRDLLEKDVDEKYYLSDRILKTILSNGSGKYYSKSEINLSIARPLTATMHKMHRANQDNYFSDDFIHQDPTKPKRIRRITPLEAYRLQGYDDQFVENAISAGVSDTQLYRQAGNTVTVTTINAILKTIFPHIY